MAYQIHPSARRVSLPQLAFASNFYDNPFINKQLLQRRLSASEETEDYLTTLSKDEHLESGNHLRKLGEIIIKPSKFQLILNLIDVCGPEDLRVKASRKGFFVSAAHHDTLENGREYVTNYFYREYLLPKAIIAEKATSWITTENLLFIEAPKKIHDDLDAGDEEDKSTHNVPDEIDDEIDVEILRQV